MYAYTLNFIHCCSGFFFLAAGGPYWVPIGSLFQSLGVPISLGDSAYDGGRDRYAPRAVVVAQSAQLAP